VQFTTNTKPARRLPSTAWKKGGPSPNPAGRPPGVPALATALRMAVEERKDDIVKTLMDKAVQGNPDALRLVAERFAPAMRATYAVGKETIVLVLGDDSKENAVNRRLANVPAALRDQIRIKTVCLPWVIGRSIPSGG